MFYVFDPDGLRFQGPLEALEQERKVERRFPVLPLQGGGRSTPFPEEAEARPTPAPEEEGGGQSPANMAVEAYLRMLNREKMVEPLVQIRQLMSSPVNTVGGETPLLEAWRTLQQTGVRQLVVVAEPNLVEGILSDRDILRRINVIDEEVEMAPDLAVRDVMQREVITTDALSDIRRVARVMAFHHLDAMAVTREDGHLVGIVTRGDILRHFAENPRLNLWA